MLLKPNESESEKNKKYKYSRHHIANQTIAEQLITTVNLSETALREDVKQRLLETLSQRDINDPYEWYDDKVIL